jgi:DNA-binding XRE family transcriptional regulator
MPSMERIEYDEKIYDTIRRNVKKYRKEQKMTAAELRKVLGIK